MNAVILHMCGYAVTNLAAFSVIMAIEVGQGDESIEGFSGLASRSPFMAMVMASSLFSLAGLPIYAGFVTKFLLFTSAVQAGLTWLMVVAVVNSLISLYYYIRIIKQMYVYEAVNSVRVSPSIVASIPIWLLFIGMVLIGIYPLPLMTAIDSATNALGPFLG